MYGIGPDVVYSVVPATDFICSWRTVLAGAILVVGLIALGIARRFGRSGRGKPWRERPRAWPFFTLGGLLVLPVLAIAANTAIGYFPNIDAVATHFGHGREIVVSAPSVMPSPTMAPTIATAAPRTGIGQVNKVEITNPPELHIQAGTTHVYLPPGYDPSGATQYPMLIMVHGSPGNYTAWVDAGLAETMDKLISSGQVRPMIVVMPNLIGLDTDDTECRNAAAGGSQVETYLEQVVVPWTQTHYPIAPSWKYHAIGGMSSGGYCALDQGLRHQEIYGTIIAIMPYDNPGRDRTKQLDPSTPPVAYTPSLYIPTLTLQHRMSAYFADGSNQQERAVRDTITKNIPLLRDLGVAVSSTIIKGSGHDWNTARNAFPQGVLTFEQEMNNPSDTYGTPGPAQPPFDH